MEQLIDGKVPAASLFSGPYYFLEQLGFRKVIDTTFMMATMITGDPEPEDVRKFFRALAARATGYRSPARTLHSLLQERVSGAVPLSMDTRRWGPGERIVFEPYTSEVFEESFQWIAQHAIFAEGQMGEGNYQEAVVTMGGEIP